jgi:SPP1 family predicted phage head-tail adaptor
MHSSRLNRRCTLLRPVETQDSSGHAAVTYATDDDVWCAIETTGGSERVSVGAVYADASHTFTIRYRADVTPKWRVSYDARTFRLQAVLDDRDERRFLRLLATEEVPARA